MNDHLKAEIKAIDEMARAARYVPARRRLAQLMEQYPGEASVFSCSAYVNSRSGNNAAALRDISAAIALSNLETDYHYVRGKLHFKTACYDKAICDFTEVIRLCDLHKSDYYRENAYFFRADAYIRTKNYDHAKRDCEHVTDGFRTWTDRLRSKQELLAECAADLT
jgi:tetratricopeptide (TPR) repeat protein